MTEEFRELYDDNVVIQTVTVPKYDQREIHVRKSRSLMADTQTTVQLCGMGLGEIETEISLLYSRCCRKHKSFQVYKISMWQC